MSGSTLSCPVLLDTSIDYDLNESCKNINEKHADANKYHFRDQSPRCLEDGSYTRLARQCIPKYFNAKNQLDLQSLIYADVIHTIENDGKISTRACLLCKEAKNVFSNSD